MYRMQFSIIIPTLNEEKFLPNLLASLSGQNRRDFEVIVSDGASKDKTIEVANSFQKKLPQLTIVTSSRSNPSVQRNAGAAKAKGDWLAFIDADSVVLPYFIDRIDAFIASNNPKLFTSWAAPDSDKAADATLMLLGNFIVEGSILLKRQVAPGPLTIVERAAFNEIGGFDESLDFGEDYDLTQRLNKQKIPLHILRETLYIFSLRRVRHQGALHLLHDAVKVIFSALFTKRLPRVMPGYVLGGHIYGKKRKSPSRSVISRLNKNIKALVKELLE